MLRRRRTHRRRRRSLPRRRQIRQNHPPQPEPRGRKKRGRMKSAKTMMKRMIAGGKLPDAFPDPFDLRFDGPLGDDPAFAGGRGGSSPRIFAMMASVAAFRPPA